MPQILDGNATAAAIKEELKERVEALKAKGITPGLGTVLVGDDPASRSGNSTRGGRPRLPLLCGRQAPRLRRDRY